MSMLPHPGHRDQQPRRLVPEVLDQFLDHQLAAGDVDIDMVASVSGHRLRRELADFLADGLVVLRDRLLHRNVSI